MGKNFSISSFLAVRDTWINYVYYKMSLDVRFWEPIVELVFFSYFLFFNYEQLKKCVGRKPVMPNKYHS